MPPRKSVLQSEVTLDAEQLRAIGCVAVESTYLEEQLDWIVRHLAVLDEHDFRVFTANLQLSGKLNLVSKLMDSRLQPEHVRERDDLFSAISKQITDRNNIIHGVWHVPTLRSTENPNDPDGPPKWIKEGEAFATRHNKGEVGFKTFKPKDLMQTAHGLSQAGGDLHRFLRKTGLYPPQRTRSLPPNPLVIRTRDSASKPTAHDVTPQKDQE